MSRYCSVSFFFEKETFLFNELVSKKVAAVERKRSTDEIQMRVEVLGEKFNSIKP